MPGETTAWKIKYALAADEIDHFPGEVSQVGAEKIDTILKEHVLIYKARGESYSAVSGELGFQSSNAKTVTLPLAATTSQIIGVFSAVAETKIATSGAALIYGDYVLGAGTIKLGLYQHVILFSNGGAWLIIAGEPKREQAYTAFAKGTFAKAETPSTSRPALVTVSLFVPVGQEEGVASVKVGGVEADRLYSKDGLPYMSSTIWVNPGVAWEVTKLEKLTGAEVYFSTILM